MKMGKAPSYLTAQLGYVRDVQPYHLRNTEEFRLPMATKGLTGLKLYNMLPEFIKEETNFNLYKRNIVQFVRNNEMKIIFKDL